MIGNHPDIVMYLSMPLLTVLLLFALPVAVILAGGLLMDTISKRAEVEGLKPLFRRWQYNETAVKDYWNALKASDPMALENEKRVLQLDLILPFFYGGAFAVSLTSLWITLNKPIMLAWQITPVVIAMAADWTENLIQLRQIQFFINSTNLQADRIRIASIATAVKMGSILLSFFLLTGLSFSVLVK